MATDTDRQSDGHSARPSRRTLTGVPGGIHAAFQVGWAAVVAVLVAARVDELFHRPSPSAAGGVVEITAVWALLAGLAWALRAVALTSGGQWGRRTRAWVRDRGRGREAAR